MTTLIWIVTAWLSLAVIATPFVIAALTVGARADELARAAASRETGEQE